MQNLSRRIKSVAGKLFGMTSQEKPGSNSVTPLPSFVMQEETDYQEDILLDPQNGLCFHDVYIPEEVVLQILTYLEPKEILRYSLVCHKWNRMIKSYSYWSTVYKRKFNKKAKKLPWYLFYCHFSTNYFNTNFIKNGNGQNKFDHWSIIRNNGDRFIIENIPAGSDPLPVYVTEFNNKPSCFATSYGMCSKRQTVKLPKSKLFKHILDWYKPSLWLSEWISGRYDCGCIYKLNCGFRQNGEDMEGITTPFVAERIDQWATNKRWRRIQLIITDYPEELDELVFEHEGRDTQFWAGHYGSKMAGGVLKFLFDSLEPLPVNEMGAFIPKKFKKIVFTNNGIKEDEFERVRHYFDMVYNGVYEFDFRYHDDIDDDYEEA